MQVGQLAQRFASIYFLQVLLVFFFGFRWLFVTSWPVLPLPC
jgi:hypothetical protein